MIHNLCVLQLNLYFGDSHVQHKFQRNPFIMLLSRTPVQMDTLSPLLSSMLMDTYHINFEEIRTSKLKLVSRNQQFAIFHVHQGS